MVKTNGVGDGGHNGIYDHSRIGYTPLNTSQEIDLAYRLNHYFPLTEKQVRYLRYLEGGRYPQDRSDEEWQPLTLEQEVRLGTKIREGDKEARELLILWNLRLAVSIANRYRGRTVPLEDITQQGYLGLLIAVDKYEPDKINPKTRAPYKFSTYAIRWIKNRIGNYLDSQRLLRFPEDNLILMKKILRIVRDHFMEYGQHPSPEEITERLNNNRSNHEKREYSAVKIGKLMDIFYRQDRKTSLDDGIGYDRSPLVSILEDDRSIGPLEFVINNDEKEALEKRIRKLTPYEKRILQLRRGIRSPSPKSLQEIGSMLGITRQAVSLTEIKARKKLLEVR